MSLRHRFRATIGRPDQASPVLQIRPAAAKAGGWNPAEIDLVHDALDWAELSEAERDFLLRLTALGPAGNEAVAIERLPLLVVTPDEQRLEEELHLTAFLWEEAKHTELFRRFFTEVALGADVGRYRTEGHRQLVRVELMAALQRLESDDSPVAQVEASVTYSLIIVGVLSETAYQASRAALENRGVLPGMRRAIVFLEEDTRRQLDHAVEMLSRLVAEHGACVGDAIAGRVAALRVPALEAVEAVFCGDDISPFGLAVCEFAEAARQRLDDRVARIAGTV